MKNSINKILFLMTLSLLTNALFAQENNLKVLETLENKNLEKINNEIFFAKPIRINETNQVQNQRSKKKKKKKKKKKSRNHRTPNKKIKQIQDGTSNTILLRGKIKSRNHRTPPIKLSLIHI